ncbi:regulator of RNase E activity RraA [Actinoalloteichus hoggarensis]|uniref:Putative 4-hydroxy-4-methyl-2-oxoglutarate aldolase n=1 Tax=Actinoalloteichus hoggarensis TaxID=1470176 RepID=A0A221VYY3_9PSEU|nr:methyltransferase [Actinoalloteichus hoggarensis]ASO18710.1 4-hydroxy-4-methyl-2-oxoglutarate aldolase [Actinoalloteichus hoggarensis]MBB5919943.1 regulator of RNase E activity RraA [Actinoalloteichus hoggarensis]
MNSINAYPSPADLPVATLSDAMERFGVADGIRPLWPGATLSGPAFTVWTRPGDNKGLHAAFETIRRGEILIVNGGGDETRALIGELVVQKARALEIGGIVLDGAARDVTELAQLGVPVFARAVTPAGPWKTGPYRIGGTIAVGGVPVHPGDWVVGDDDGVAIVPEEQRAEVVRIARELIEGEARRRAANQGLVPRD